MNCGFGNLATLKTFVLPEGQQADTTYDGRLILIGKGVAAWIENQCNRKIAYATGDIYDCPANQTYISLPRYPIWNVSDIQEKDTADDNWQSLGAVSDTALNISHKSGLVEFGFIVAPYFGRLRVIYDGGFFFETKEPTDAGYPTAVPTFGTNNEPVAELPDDLQQAWLEGSQRIFERARTVSLSGIKDVTRAGVQLLDMADELAAMIAPYRRFA